MEEELLRIPSNGTDSHSGNVDHYGEDGYIFGFPEYLWECAWLVGFGVQYLSTDQMTTIVSLVKDNAIKEAQSYYEKILNDQDINTDDEDYWHLKGFLQYEKKEGNNA